MELPSAFVFIFYIWLASSLGIIGYRIYRRAAFKETKADRAERRRAAQAAAAGEVPAGTDLAPTRPVGPAGPAAGSGSSAPPRASRSDPVVEIVPGSLVEQVIREELAVKKQAGTGDTKGDAEGDPTTADGTDPAEASSRRGFFASPDDTAAPTRPVSELVAGITMPCDLAPLVDGALDPYRVVFVTNGHPPAKVGSALADELERLGYALRNDSDTELTATRGDDVVHVELHPEPATERRDGERVFPTASGSSVVIVLHS